MTLIYKICSLELWESAKIEGYFYGADIDIQDGFIHCCSALQIAETLSLHFSGVPNLMLLTIDSSTLDIKWEPARAGEMFPHLYNFLPLSSVTKAEPIAINDDGFHLLLNQP